MSRRPCDVEKLYMRLIYFLTFSLVSGRSPQPRPANGLRCAARLGVCGTALFSLIITGLLWFSGSRLFVTAFCCVYVPRKIGRECS